jgi:hypothetical protein
MVQFKKYSEWTGTDLPPLPANQWLPGDAMVVIRGGEPFAYDPVSRFAFASMGDNAAPTTINTVDVWESIAGTLTVSAADQGFTLASNIYTVTAETSLFPILIAAECTAMKVGGGTAVNFQFGIFINDVMVGVGQTALASAAQWGSAGVSVPAILAQGDTVEIKVRNRTDADDVVVSDMSFRID